MELVEAVVIAVLQPGVDRLLERVGVDDLRDALGREHDLVALGQLLARLDVLLVLVHQAAAQATAHSRDLFGVERDALLLGHLDADRAELGQEHRAAAVFEAAGAEAADDLGHVARPDLPKGDELLAEGGLHVFAQRLQVDARIFVIGAGPQEREPRTVVAELGLDDLDAVELELEGPGAAVDHGRGLLRLPMALHRQIAGRGRPEDALVATGRRRDPLRRDLLDDFAELPSAGGLHDHLVSGADIEELGSVEVIHLADAHETHTDDVRQRDGGGGRQGVRHGVLLSQRTCASTSRPDETRAERGGRQQGALFPPPAPSMQYNAARLSEEGTHVDNHRGARGHRP